MDDKTAKIVAARLALRERFEAKMGATPSIADPAPEGTGPLNRHGMPKLPVGQTVTKKWPVLDLGVAPNVTKSTWSLTVDGACEKPLKLGFAELLALEQVEDTSDFHCVTTWSKMDVRWVGVRVSEVLALAEPTATAGFVMCHGFD